MPKMLTKEELMLNITGIRYALRDDISARTGFEQVLSHIDALTERLEAMADEWGKHAVICHQDPPCDGCKALIQQRDDYANELREFVRKERDGE